MITFEMFEQKIKIDDNFKVLNITGKRKGVIEEIVDTALIVCDRPQDGFPELLIKEILKKLGTKNVRVKLPKEYENLVF